jgi:hypothetical protein
MDSRAGNFTMDYCFEAISSSAGCSLGLFQFIVLWDMVGQKIPLQSYIDLQAQAIPRLHPMFCMHRDTDPSLEGRHRPTPYPHTKRAKRLPSRHHRKIWFQMKTFNAPSSYPPHCS